MKKIFVCLFVICIIFICLVGCTEYPKTFPNIVSPQSPEYRTYDNFNMFKSDFETVVSVVERNGTGGYYMNGESGRFRKKIKAEDEVGYKLIDIALNESEKESVKNVVQNSYMDTISNVTFNSEENYVWFFEEQQACGVVYTEDIDGFLETCIKNYYYTVLSENWYAIYR